MNKIYKMISVFLLTLLVIVSCPITKKAASATGNEWFVSENGTSTDCSRTHPGPLQYCVEKAQSGDTVYVGEGFYQSQNNPLADNLLFIQKSLHLVGSCTWDSTGPVVCYPQNKAPSTSTSYLDGNDQQRVIAIQGLGISVSIEGFQIQQGNAENKQPKPGGSNILGAGGGVFAIGFDELVLKNNFIWSNRASETGTSSTDYAHGGGVFIYGVENLDINDNTFLFNSASSPHSSGFGGGLFVSSCDDVNIRFNRFTENMVGNTTTESTGAGAYLNYIKNLDLSDNIFEYHNHTIRQDLIGGSALALDETVNANRIDHNLFHKNLGNSIVDIQGLTGPLTRNTFWDNEGYEVLNIEGENDIAIVNNFFGKVQGQFDSKFIAINENIHGDIPIVDITNNTFAQGSFGICVGNYAYVDIFRNIFAYHQTHAIYVSLGNLNVNVNENMFWDNDDGTTGTTYWEEDPKFVDLSTENLHLQWDSAAIDKVSGGNITTDIDGDPRPIGSGIDLGADEYGAFIFLPMISR